MTKSEYQDYQDRFEHGAEGITAMSCKEDCETYFSWKPCDICGRSLGGDRHDMTALLGDEIIEVSVCTDCVYYNEYGQLDDMTMMDMEDDEDE